VKRKNIFKILLVFVVLFGFGGVISVFSKTLVDYYDDIFKTNEFTIYTEEQITDDETLYRKVSDVVYHYNTQEYYNSYNDYSSLRLLAQNCKYDKMTCDFRLERSKTSNGEYTVEDVKTYEGIKVKVDSNLDSYFTMVKDGKVTINYDESMFVDETAKINYIISYFNMLNSGGGGVDISYSYNYANKIISRTVRTDLMVTSYMEKKIDDIVFEYTEEEYSDEFKKLTSGTLTIKSDTPITRNMLEQRIHSVWLTKGGFSLDGEIINNKVFIKRMKYVDNGPSEVVEKHLVTIVQDTNIDMDLFKKVGLETSASIPAEKPSKNLSSYLSGHFNQLNYSFELDDGGYERFEHLIEWDQNDYIIVKYEKRDDDDNVTDIQFHKVPVVFSGYSDVVSAAYKKKVGNEVVISADSLSRDEINLYFGYNPFALGCNDDVSYCDVGLYDHETNTFEIHNVKITLNNVISEDFKKAFNIKADGKFDIIVGNGVYVQYFNPYIYVEETGDSLQFSCGTVNEDSPDKKCTLTLKNYLKDISENHTVEYNILRQNASTMFKSFINSEINVYPGERQNALGNLSYSYDFFPKKNINTNMYSVGQCSALDNTCPVMMLNDKNVLEVHNTKVHTLEGESPEFKKAIKGDTLKLNSIYKDDLEFLYRASMGYLMSRTKSWSYLDDITETQAKVVFNNLETHTKKIEFVEANKEHQAIVASIVDKIGNKPLQIEINDLEFINDFYYREDSDGMHAPNFNSKMLNDVLNKLIDNQHVSYFLAVEGGMGGPFIQASAGSVVLYYDGIAYATSKSYVETVMKNIVYIPSNTENTREAYVKAVQKRIDNYLGKKSGVTVSFSRILDEDEVDPYFFDVESLDGDVYKLTYKDKETEILVIKDSSKMQTSTFNAMDVSNNVKVSSDNANYPTNTVVSSELIDDEDTEAKKLLKKLGLKEAEIVDINLYSPSIGDIENFSNVDFSVNVPIDTDEIGDEDLYAYYINDDGSIEEHPVVVDDFMASFETNHFSTYIIGKKVDDDVINPNTYDGLLKHIILLCLSGLVLGGCAFYLKKSNN